MISTRKSASARSWFPRQRKLEIAVECTVIPSQTRRESNVLAGYTTELKEYGQWCTFTRAASIVLWVHSNQKLGKSILPVSHMLMASTVSVRGEPERVNLVVRALKPDYLLLDIFLHFQSETWIQWTIEASQVKVHHRPYSLMMVQWCIQLTRLTLVCKVIRYSRDQVRQNLKKILRWSLVLVVPRQELQSRFV